MRRVAGLAFVLGFCVAGATGGPVGQSSVEGLRAELRALQMAPGQLPEQQLEQARDSLYEGIQSMSSDNSLHGGVPVKIIAARYSLQAASLFLHRFGRVNDAYDFAADAADLYDSLGTPEGDLAAAEIMAKVDDQVDSVTEGMRLYDEQFQDDPGGSTATKKGGGGKKKKGY